MRTGERVGVEEGVSVEEKVRAIKDFTAPRTKKQLRSFLGMIHFYKPYVKDLAATCAPLYKMTGKHIPFKALVSSVKLHPYSADKEAAEAALREVGAAQADPCLKATRF